MACPKCAAGGESACTPRQKRHWSRWFWVAVVLGLTLLFLRDAADAAVYQSKASALEMAFPGADSVVTESVFLDEDLVARIRTAAGTAPDRRILNRYVGWKDGEKLGCAYFETHRVRTLPETLMVVVRPAGEIAAVHLIAFHEPPEYRASDRWLEQYASHSLDRDLALGRGVAGIGGATLTAHAVNAAVRRVLALDRLSRGPARTLDSASLSE